MPKTLDQALHALQIAQALGQEKKLAALKELHACLIEEAAGSAKSLDSIAIVLPPILSSSQVIACESALECVGPLVALVACRANTRAARSLLSFVLPPLLDRLGDGRMSVRELALVTLRSMWLEFHSMSNGNHSVPATLIHHSGLRQSMAAGSSFTPMRSSHSHGSPGHTEWSPVHAFEREMATRGLKHKIWRVREMVLEWINGCVEEYPEFPPLSFVSGTFKLLDDTQDSVRFASKRALNNIYHTRPELQQELLNRAQNHHGPHRQSLISAITAPVGELAAMPASPYGNARSGSRLAMGHGVTRPGSRMAYGMRSKSRAGSSLGGRQLQPPSSPASMIPSLPGSAVHLGEQRRITSIANLNHNYNGSPSRAGFRSMSQQGFRPGSRAGYSQAGSPISSTRTGGIIQQSPSRSSFGKQSTSALTSQAMMGSSFGSFAPLSMPMPADRMPAISHRKSQEQQFKDPPRHLLARKQSSSLLRLAMESFVPSSEVPDEVTVHNVPSKHSLATEFSNTIDVFGGRETEENWTEREHAVGLYRGIIWGNASIEFCDDLVCHLKEDFSDILNAVHSLRTSLSSSGMGLCEDIAKRLGPHASPLFDFIVEALIKQCAQTKKIAAQRASRSLQIVFKCFPLRAKSVNDLRLRMEDKSAILRQAIVATCQSILRSDHHIHNLDAAVAHSGRHRHADALHSIVEVTKRGVTDAQPTVRESSRELFWTLHSLASQEADQLLDTLPDSARHAISRDRTKYSPVTVPHQGAATSTQSPLSSLAFSNVVSGEIPNSLLEHEDTARDSNKSSSVPSRKATLNEVDGEDNRHGSMGAIGGEGFDISHDHLENINTSPNHNQQQQLHPSCVQVQRVRTPAQPRMSLGLIDFDQVGIGSSLMDIDVDILPSQHHLTTIAETGSFTPAFYSKSNNRDAIAMEDDSQVTEVAAEVADMRVTPVASTRTLTIMPDSTDMDVEDAANEEAMFEAESARSSKPSTPTTSNTPKTPHKDLLLHRSNDIGTGQAKDMDAMDYDHSNNQLSLSPSSETRRPSTASIQSFDGHAHPFATPRTQTARYWHGPLDTGIQPLSFASNRLVSIEESPMPPGTPQRLGKVDDCLHCLAVNNNVDDGLFRVLARFAKEESSNLWAGPEKGGLGYLERMLTVFTTFLHSPPKHSNTIFNMEHCLDLMRVLVLRQTQYFTLDTARTMLLEVLRNKYNSHSNLSSTAEDALSNMASQLDTDLCLALCEDFFQRAPLPAMPDFNLAATTTDIYAMPLKVHIKTPSAIDPMGVFGMDNALAATLEFATETIRQRPLPLTMSMHELDQFMPYVIQCFFHSRSQVRKAAMEPVITLFQRLEMSGPEIKELLIRMTPGQLSQSHNPVAKYVKQLHRLELRRHIWYQYHSSLQNINR